MAKPRILLVGGAGYIGSVCGLSLARAGFHVSTLDDLSTGHREAAAGQLYVADLLKPEQLAPVFADAQPDAVLHFAARSIVGESVRKPLDYFHANVTGTLNLLHAMRDAGCARMVFSSTCAVFGDPVRLPLDEDHPRQPLNPYGHTKEMIERILEACREREGMSVAVLRYFNAAGAMEDGQLGEVHLPETHLIPLALDACLGRRPPLSVFGTDYDTPDGTCVRDYVHVEDLADAHRLALQQLLEGSRGRDYNLGTGRGTSVREVLDTIATVTGTPVPHSDAERRPGDAPALYAAADRAAEELGWRAQRSFTDIVRTAAQWAERPRFGPNAG
jgi:UDP-glucose 4-epimerase